MSSQKESRSGTPEGISGSGLLSAGSSYEQARSGELIVFHNTSLGVEGSHVGVERQRSERDKEVGDIMRYLIEVAEDKDLARALKCMEGVQSIFEAQGAEGKGKLKYATIAETNENVKEYTRDGRVVFIPKEEGGEAIVVGDIHGDLEALSEVAEKFIKSKLDAKSMHIVFLGDIFDRGKKQVEAAKLLFNLILMYPEDVTWLRGDHEELGTVGGSDFKAALGRFYEVGDKDQAVEKIHYLYGETLKSLPVMAVAGDMVMVHGGPPAILPEGGLSGFASETVKNIPGMEKNDVVKLMFKQMLWADLPHRADYESQSRNYKTFKEKLPGRLDLFDSSSPKTVLSDGTTVGQLRGLRPYLESTSEGFMPNTSRGDKDATLLKVLLSNKAIMVFDEVGLDTFLNAIGARGMLRGHQYYKSGHVDFGKVGTIHTTGKGSKDAADGYKETPATYARFPLDGTPVELKNCISPVWGNGEIVSS